MQAVISSGTCDQSRSTTPSSLLSDLPPRSVSPVIEPAANGGVNVDTPVTRRGNLVPKSLLNITYLSFCGKWPVRATPPSSSQTSAAFSFLLP